MFGKMNMAKSRITNSNDNAPIIKDMKDLKGKTLTKVFASHSQRNIGEPRKVISVNTVGMKLEGGSSLDFYPKARQEIIGNKLTLYGMGSRELNSDEKYALTTGFEKAMIERFGSMESYKEACYNDSMTDGSQTYRAEKSYFEKIGYPYLFTTHPNKRLDKNSSEDIKNRRIFENSIKGEKELEYIIS